MKITIYRKTRTTKHTDGSRPKTFNVYITKLTKKTGETITVTVKPTGDLKTDFDRMTKFPFVAEFQKKNANLDKRLTTTKDGDFIDTYTLWLKKVDKYEEFIDTSLDDFEWKYL